MRVVTFSIPIAMLLVLSACAPMTPPALPLATPASLAMQLSHGQAAWPQQQWWLALGDTQLNGLITHALQAAPSWQLAQARLRQAIAASEGAQAALAPKATLSTSVTPQRYSSHGSAASALAGNWRTSGQLSLDFAYDLDLGGTKQAQALANLQRVAAAQADQAQAALLLSSAVAHAYWSLAQRYAEQEIAQASYESAQRAATLYAKRQRAGFGLASEVASADSQASAALQQVHALAAQIVLQQQALAVLVGAGPSLATRLQRPQLQPLATTLPTVLAVDLLGKRPDLLAARWRVEASGQELERARAAFYPNVNLFAAVGYSALGISQWLTAASRVASVGPALSLPLFDAGARTAALEGSAGLRDAAISDYNQTLIQAVGEVADAIVSVQALQAQQVVTQRALTQAKQARADAQARVRAGLLTPVAALSFDAPYFVQQRQFLELQVRTQQAYIALIKALGGGMPILAVPSS